MSTGDSLPSWGPPWPPPPDGPAPVDGPSGLPLSEVSAIRRYSVALAVAVTGGWSLIGWVISGTNPTGGIYFWAFLPTIPIMAVVAYWLAPRMVTARSAVCPALIAGLVTVIANAYVLGCVMAVPMFGPHPAVLVQGFGLAVIGLMFFGLPGLIISVPSAFLWAVLTREMYSRRRPQRSSAWPVGTSPVRYADPSTVQ